MRITASAHLRFAALALLGVTLMDSAHAETPPPSPEILRLIDGYRSAKQFQGNDVAVLLGPSGRMDAATLALLARGLAEADSDARAELALALVLSARASDPLRGQGREAILDERVADVLGGAGIAKNDGAKETCLRALIDAVPARLAARRGAELLASLKESPDPTTALAVAKAKPAGAREVLERLMKSGAADGGTPAFRIARAAAGDAALERGMIRAFREETSFKKKAALARELGLLGTPAALKALGEALRSPLIDEGELRRRSFRVDVLDALRLSYPDRVELIWRGYADDRGYAAAEKFVAESFGVSWSAPRPLFFTQYDAPQPAPPPR